MNCALSEQDRQAIQQQAESYQWVDDDRRLAELCQQWREQPLLGLDTEFQRTDTFYPRPGLIQIASAGQCYLIDPLAIRDFEPLVVLLRDPGVLKVLHAGSEDLELLSHCYGVVPAPLFDCQVACAFLGYGLSIGYQRLLSTLFDVEVGKEETRSDWLQRPLTEAQKHYAALDVVYLEPIYQLLEARLREQGKYDWVMEECSGQAESAAEPEDFQKSYLQRFKQCWKLAPRNLGVLQALSAWRERVARERDMPRNFLLHNQSIMAMAFKPPLSMRDLSQVERIRGRTLKQDGQQLLSLVEAAWQCAPADYPEPAPKPLPARWNRRLKPLKALVGEKAEALQLAPEMLVRRKDLEQLVRSGVDSGNFSLPEGLRGWREQVIGEPLLAHLRQQEQSQQSE